MRHQHTRSTSPCVRMTSAQVLSIFEKGRQQLMEISDHLEVCSSHFPLKIGTCRCFRPRPGSPISSKTESTWAEAMCVRWSATANITISQRCWAFQWRMQNGRKKHFRTNQRIDTFKHRSEDVERLPTHRLAANRLNILFECA